MNAPFFKYGLFGDEASLIVAFVIGIAFGFVLERAGFGNARVLAAQFYFRDLRVLKVMFTAIITAMVGVFVLARVGVLDLSLIYLTPTLLLPQIVGGVILGAGFIIGGYCPGTSCVSAATGRIDGLVYLAGMVGGLAGFAEVYPSIANFAQSTPLGKITLPQLLHIPYGVLVAAVVLMAIGAFVAAEWAEKKVGGKPPEPDSLLAPTRRLVPVRRLALAFVAIGLFAAVAGGPYRGAFARVDTQQLALDAGTADLIAPAQLADWLVEGRNDFLLIDVRDSTAFARYHLPSATNVPLAALNAEVAAHNERIIVYADTDVHAAQAWLILRAAGFPAAYLLSGGVEAWQAQVLYPRAPAADAPAREQIDFARRAAVARHFGGSPQGAGAAIIPAAPELPQIAPPAPAAPTGPRPVTRKKKEGC
ncbi:YeeE/YedE thiosulfate transporter family protein [Opitutus terrae]|uniref:Rhodanese domain protein n=1 Tax=Opitutus terrae (strain DSM 11246 / JCM 15787 / PB90-1) TaxID=452637 RepID=B1ZSP7_OPITP|nr:YeeE/YedE thiosulfate transporter family protein [Opitutus terrae]ACB74746.1 Rhodanese domain protein [Opitutus terrae PB90-1]